MVVTVVSQLPPVIQPGTLVVLHRFVPEKLPSGPLFVVDPQGPCDFWDLGEELGAPLITQQMSDSPLMAHVRLDNVQMPTAQQLKFHQPAQVLAGALTGDPIFAAWNRPTGKILVLTGNLDEGDLAFRTAFPILVANSVGWFNSNIGELREIARVGQYHRDRSVRKSNRIGNQDWRTRPSCWRATRLFAGPTKRREKATADGPGQGHRGTTRNMWSVESDRE